jgi:hypothetical protein
MIIIETHWLLQYLAAAWVSGFEAHERNPDMHDSVMRAECRKIALMAAGFSQDEPPVVHAGEAGDLGSSPSRDGGRKADRGRLVDRTPTDEPKPT